MKPDKEIWNDLRKGESYALSHIYNKYVRILYCYGQKFSNDKEQIKDTIQELFFDLIRTRNNLGETDNICFYLMASFRRKLAKSLNEKKIFELDNKYELKVEIIYSAEHELINKEKLNHREKAVKKALEKLTPRQREILYYKFTCNFDYKQICELMDIQYDSARKQVSRALKALKEILDDSDILLLFLM